MGTRAYNRRIINKSVIQAILFNRSWWNEHDARLWILKHSFNPIKIAISDNFIHYRLREPSEFSRIRTITTTRGIEIRIGFYI